MKKKLLVLVLSAVMAVGMMSGCGAKSDTSDTKAKTAESSSAKEEETEEQTECELEDGTYTAEFKTDSGMFHVNEANDGKGTLTVKDGKMTIHDVDLVVMAGGSSKMPLIQKYIRHLFHKAPMVQGNCDELIALGLGLVCGVKERKEEIKDYILTDICPFSLGVATINEADPDRAYMANIINRNTVLPCSRVRRFYTASDQQDYVVVEVHQGENTYAQDNLLLGKIEISVPPKPKGKEAVDVRFTYDINGILMVDTRVVSTGVVKTHIISQKIPEAELEERVRELEKLKVHPRDLSENQQMMERLEALYQEVYPEQKEQVQQMIRTFEEFLDGQNPRQIQGYRRYLEKAVSMLEYYDPFEEEFDASESDWDLWDEEEAQDPDNEETDEEEYWKKEGDDHSWTS